MRFENKYDIWNPRMQIDRNIYNMCCSISYIGRERKKRYALSGIFVCDRFFDEYLLRGTNGYIFACLSIFLIFLSQI